MDSVIRKRVEKSQNISRVKTHLLSWSGQIKVLDGGIPSSGVPWPLYWYRYSQTVTDGGQLARTDVGQEETSTKGRWVGLDSKDWVTFQFDKSLKVHNSNNSVHKKKKKKKTVRMTSGDKRSFITRRTFSTSYKKRGFSVPLQTEINEGLIVLKVENELGSRVTVAILKKENRHYSSASQRRIGKSHT